MFDQECTKGYKNSELVYFLEVGCTADFIYVFDKTEYKFQKSKIANILVSLDIFIVLFIVLSIWYSGWNDEKISQEINDKNIAPS